MRPGPVVLASLADAAVAWRWWILAGLFLAISAWEILRPERPHEGSLGLHWLGNLALAAASIALARQVSPADLGLPLGAEASGAFGLAQRWGGEAAVLALGVVALDLYAYASHRLQHAAFPLWRFHAVHHADEQVNAGTALRQHPVIYVANGLAGACLLGALGLPLWVFPLYGLLSVAWNLVAHANTGLPPRLEAALQRVLATPGMHRLHHSAHPADHDTNFGNVLSVFDHLFGTYRRAPAASGPPRFGIAGHRAPPGLRGLRWPWVLPFVLRPPPGGGGGGGGGGAQS